MIWVDCSTTSLRTKRTQFGPCRCCKSDSVSGRDVQYSQRRQVPKERGEWVGQVVLKFLDVVPRNSQGGVIRDDLQGDDLERRLGRRSSERVKIPAKVIHSFTNYTQSSFVLRPSSLSFGLVVVDVGFGNLVGLEDIFFLPKLFTSVAEGVEMQVQRVESLAEFSSIQLSESTDLLIQTGQIES